MSAVNVGASMNSTTHKYTQIAYACPKGWLRATSEAHLERTVDRLKRGFEVEASVGRPTVVYLETLDRPAEGSAKHVRVAHGRREYAHVSLWLYGVLIIIHVITCYTVLRGREPERHAEHPS